MAEVREIATGLAFPEGPIFLPNGEIFIVEIASAKLTKISLNGDKTLVA